MSEQQSETIVKPSPVEGFDWIKPPGVIDGSEATPKFNFDVEKYLAQAKDFDMSEEEKVELITILWDIMCRFVELGFGLDSISILGEQISQKPSDETGFMLDCKDNQKTE